LLSALVEVSLLGEAEEFELFLRLSPLEGFLRLEALHVLIDEIIGS